MSHIDRRKQFRTEPWQQGQLLSTLSVQRYMSKEQRDEADEIEHCMAFAFFTPKDEGRSREFVYRFESPGDCKVAVIIHNHDLTDRKLIQYQKRPFSTMSKKLGEYLRGQARKFVLQDFQDGIKRNVLWGLYRCFTKAQIRKIIKGGH